jgi:hypothetical protein
MGFRSTGGVSGDTGSEADGENQLPFGFRSFTRLSDGAERTGPARADPSLKLCRSFMRHSVNRPTSSHSWRRRVCASVAPVHTTSRFVPRRENRAPDAFTRPVHRVGHCLALARHKGQPHAMVRGAGPALDQPEALQLRQLPADCRVVPTDAIGEIDNPDRAAPLDFARKSPRPRESARTTTESGGPRSDRSEHQGHPGGRTDLLLRRRYLAARS